MFGRNPDKLEAKALAYEQKGKTQKAQKYRMKAANLRAKQSGTTGTTGMGTTGLAGSGTGFTSSRTPATYEQNALKWEQRGNFQKAQKNREKVWRLQNPSYPITTQAPMFYNSNNQFLGYNQPQQNRGLAQQNVLPAVVETHVHPTIIQQTTRPEKIVEVQPVVHREIEAPTVHVVERHSYESVPSNRPGLITNQPIIQETLHPRVIEEIQPIVHREVPAPFVERVEQHVTERVVQPTTMTKDVINDGFARQTGPAIAAGGPIAPQSGLGGLNQGGLNQGGLNSGLNQGGLNSGLNQGGLNSGLSGQSGLNSGLNSNSSTMGTANNTGLNSGLNSGRRL